jgi:hypothetical protein
MIPEAVVTQIKERTDLIALIGETVKLMSELACGAAERLGRVEHGRKARPGHGRIRLVADRRGRWVWIG